MRGRLVTLAVCLLTALACLFVYHDYTKWQPPLQADETGHALPAARMAIDLRRGDASAFLADTEREMMWPFVHPWVLSACFLAFGVSSEVGRAASLGLFGVAVVLAFLLARELSSPSSAEHGGSAEGRAAEERWHADGRKGAIGGDGAPPARPAREGAGTLGALSALLMMLTTAFWQHSSMLMIEPLGMAVTLAALIAHARAARQPSDARFVVAGLLAAATFLTKYNYGLPVVAALVLAAAVARGPGRPRMRHLAFFLAACAIPVAAWLAHPFPEKLQAFYGFSVNRDEGLSGLQDLLFYPRGIAEMISWPVALGLFAALALSLRSVRDGRSSASTLFVIGSLAMITAHPNKQERYVFTALPVLYVLGELELRRVARIRLSPRMQAITATTFAALLVVALDPRAELREQRHEGESLAGAARIADFVVGHVDPKERTLVLGSAGLLPHLLFQWELVARKGAIDAVVDNLPFPGEEGWDPRYRRGYPKEMTADYDRVLSAALGPDGYDRVVTLEIAADSAFMPDWLQRWDAWGQNYVVLMGRQSQYPVVAEEAFPESGVRVRVYARP